MKLRVLGMLLLGSAPAPAHAQPKLLSAGRAAGTQPDLRIEAGHATKELPRQRPPGAERPPRPFDPKLPRDSKLVAPHDAEWQLAPWTSVQTERPTPPAKVKIQICPANLSGGRGIKIKIPI